MDRAEAQARLYRIRAFQAELATLQQDGAAALDAAQLHVISDYHRRLLSDLTARFDLDRDEGQQRMSLGMRIASLLGAIALSAAVFLLFYRIWGRLATTVQVTTRLVPVDASIDAGALQRRYPDRSRYLILPSVVAGWVSRQNRSGETPASGRDCLRQRGAGRRADHGAAPLSRGSSPECVSRGHVPLARPAL